MFGKCSVICPIEITNVCAFLATVRIKLRLKVHDILATVTNRITFKWALVFLSPLRASRGVFASGMLTLWHVPVNRKPQRCGR